MRSPAGKRLFLFVPLSLIYLAGFFFLDRWPALYTRGDDVGYYLHVVAFWINQDTGDYARTTADLLQAHPEAKPIVEDPYLIRTTDIGRRYIKYSLGVGLMETPFFLLAHAYATRSDGYRSNGWDKPYYLAISLGNLLCILLGLYLLMGLLEAHFSRRAAAWATLAVALASNLYFHAVYFTMAHGFLFLQHSLLLGLTSSYYRRPSTGKSLQLGLIVGLIGITRVPELIVALVPLLWGVTSKATLRQRLDLLRRHPLHLLTAALGFTLVFSLQLGYWHFVSGKVLFNPYQGEGFQFLHPKVLKGWFDFANGWLIYSPIMVFSLVGLFWLRRSYPPVLLPLLVFVGLHAYIHYSYYAWTYFPGLGQRPMIETYPLLAYGLAALAQALAERKAPWVGALPWVALFFFTWLNLFQTWQTSRGLIRSERGNLAFYLETFARVQSSRRALVAFDSGLPQPDTTQLLPFRLLAREGFEDSLRFPEPAGQVFSGARAMALDPDQSRFPLTPPLPLGDLPPQSWLKASIRGFMPSRSRVWNRDRCAELILEIRDGQGQKQLRRGIAITSHIGNPSYSIWSAGEADQWGKAYFFVRWPRRATPSWTVQAWIRNREGQRLFLDDFQLEALVAR